MTWLWARDTARKLGGGVTGTDRTVVLLVLCRREVSYMAILPAPSRPLVRVLVASTRINGNQFELPFTISLATLGRRQVHPRFRRRFFPPLLRGIGGSA